MWDCCCPVHEAGYTIAVSRETVIGLRPTFCPPSALRPVATGNHRLRRSTPLASLDPMRNCYVSRETRWTSRCSLVTGGWTLEAMSGLAHCFFATCRSGVKPPRHTLDQFLRDSDDFWAWSVVRAGPFDWDAQLVSRMCFGDAVADVESEAGSVGELHANCANRCWIPSSGDYYWSSTRRPRA